MVMLAGGGGALYDLPVPAPHPDTHLSDEGGGHMQGGDIWPSTMYLPDAGG